VCIVRVVREAGEWVVPIGLPLLKVEVVRHVLIDGSNWQVRGIEDERLVLHAGVPIAGVEVVLELLPVGLGR
jgi:hypothetical protein